MISNNEIWSPIKDFEGIYEVSSLGRIRSFKSGNPVVLKLFNRTRGYAFVTLSNGKRKNKYNPSVHRLVATAFIPNTENKPHVNHINSDPSDNRIENLEWCTHAENMRHAVINNRKPSKYRSGLAHRNTKKLLCLITGQIVTTKVASEFLSLTKGMVSQMLTGKSPNWTNYVYA